MRKLTTTDFIVRAKEIHHDKYDYGEAEYVSAKSSISIICPEHGLFSQRSSNHLSGIGCPKCGHDLTGKKKRSSVEKFVKKATAVHGDRYDYSNVQYETSIEDVEILCTKHGIFLQRPANHLMGKGCPQCGQDRSAELQRDTLEGFSKKAHQVHNDKYIYPAQQYVNGLSKIEIICPVHGKFYQAPTKHLAGSGCQECGLSKRGLARRGSTESFVGIAIQTHGEKYDYSKVEYVLSTLPVTIICREHGEFEQIPWNHLSGVGCPACSNLSRAETNRMSFSDFVIRANKLHKNQYQYREADFRKSYCQIWCLGIQIKRQSDQFA
jgi:ssDNA-binding Zn-finger/Zn-ribbon topoisomerase 1